MGNFEFSANSWNLVPRLTTLIAHNSERGIVFDQTRGLSFLDCKRNQPRISFINFFNMINEVWELCEYLFNQFSLSSVMSTL